jgi:hypothetical protein
MTREDMIWKLDGLGERDAGGRTILEYGSPSTTWTSLTTNNVGTVEIVTRRVARAARRLSVPATPGRWRGVRVRVVAARTRSTRTWR